MEARVPRLPYEERALGAGRAAAEPRSESATSTTSSGAASTEAAMEEDLRRRISCFRTQPQTSFELSLLSRNRNLAQNRRFSPIDLTVRDRVRVSEDI